MRYVAPEADSEAAALGSVLPWITLYKDDNFHGDWLDIQGGDCPWVGDDFNDTCSSIVVHSGKWQVCVDANFGYPEGPVLGPGTYPKLDPLKITNDSVSSVKLVSW